MNTSTPAPAPESSASRTPGDLPAPPSKLTVAGAISAITERILALSLLDILQQRPRRKVLSYLGSLIARDAEHATKEAFGDLMKNWSQNLPSGKKRGKSRTSTDRNLLTRDEVIALIREYTFVPFDDPRIAFQIGNQIEKHLLEQFPPHSVREVIVEVIAEWEKGECEKAGGRKATPRKSKKTPAGEMPASVQTEAASVNLGDGPQPGGADEIASAPSTTKRNE